VGEWRRQIAERFRLYTESQKTADDENDDEEDGFEARL
jgi:hypothetical protein